MLSVRPCVFLLLRFVVLAFDWGLLCVCVCFVLFALLGLDLVFSCVSFFFFFFWFLVKFFLVFV